MVGVIHYGMGNEGSILNMLHKLGEEAIVVKHKDELESADKIILPGVGSFDRGMENLQELNFINAIRQEVLEKKKPLLGICLGMQLLGRKSEEGTRAGMGLIPFDNIRFRFENNDNLKVPHMGWNIVDFQQTDKVLEGIEGRQRYYFVHSYHAVCDNKENILMTCEYGYTFVAAVKRENIYGVQFHPEKSHRFGMRFLDNFVRRI